MYVASARPAAGADTGTSSAPRSLQGAERPRRAGRARRPGCAGCAAPPSTPTRRPRTSSGSAAAASRGRPPSTLSSSAGRATDRASGPTRSRPGRERHHPAHRHHAGGRRHADARRTATRARGSSRRCRCRRTAAPRARRPRRPIPRCCRRRCARTSWGLWVRPNAEVWVERPQRQLVHVRAAEQQRPGPAQPPGDVGVDPGRRPQRLGARSS